MPSVGTRRSDTKVLSSLKRTTPGRSPIERHHACPPQGVHSSSSGPELASAPSEGSYVVVRFAPQASADEITKFLGAYKATVVGGPLNGQLYRIRLSETKLPREEVGKIVRQMQSESNVVGFIAAKE